MQGPGHCTACHTPKTVLGGDKTADHLRGFNLQGWFAPDVTGDNSQGLGQWSEADITGYLKTGHNRMTAATGPMAEEVVDATSKYSDGDLAAIAIYLKSLPQRQDNAAPVPANSPVMIAGEAIYRDQCSATSFAPVRISQVGKEAAKARRHVPVDDRSKMARRSARDKASTEYGFWISSNP